MQTRSDLSTIKLLSIENPVHHIDLDHLRKEVVCRIIQSISRWKLGRGRRGKPPWNKGLKGAQIAWNKGIPQSEEAKEKNRIAHTGPNSSCYGKPAWNSGLKNTYKHTE
ncbi:MAG: NUMOD3 domain-containing DNA-binding protein [Nitrososphaeraceae archaeon]